MDETPLQEALRAALDSDERVRLRGALRLGTLADEDTVPELVALLVGERDPFVLETLTWAVVARGAVAVPPLVAALEEHPDARAQVLHTLSKLQDPAAVVDVLPWVDDEDPRVAAKAWWVIGRTGLPETAPVLVARLGQEDAEQRSALSRALEQMGAPAAPLLGRVLLDPAATQEVRRHALEVLTLLGPDAAGALDGLVAVAEGSEKELALLALEALAPVDSPRVVEVLTRLRDEGGAWTATVADWLLGQRDPGV